MNTSRGFPQWRNRGLLYGLGTLVIGERGTANPAEYEPTFKMFVVFLSCGCTKHYELTEPKEGETVYCRKHGTATVVDDIGEEEL